MAVPIGGRNNAVLVVAGAVLLSATPARAQIALPTDTTQLVELRLRDGSVLYGRVVEATGARVVVRTAAGAVVEVPRAEVERVRAAVGDVRSGRFWAEDPNRTRLFFTSTARALRAGEGYVSDYFFVLPFVAYGVSDRVTIAGGTPLVPEVIGRVWYAAPKVTLAQSPRGAFAVGGLGFVDARDAREGSIGVLYGVGTVGGTDRAITVGAGWGYATADGKRSGISNDPVVVLGGETRVARRLKLLTENWVFSGDGGAGGVFSGGVRFIGDRLSADLGLMGYGDGRDAACCLPVVNFVWVFGGR